MEKIAFIGENIYIYWSPIIITIAALSAIFLYASIYIIRGGKPIALPVSIALSICLSIPLARFIHWYCRTGLYSSFSAAMSDYSSGGFALEGVIFGCLIAASLVRVLKLSDNLPGMLDAMSLAGGIGIAVGRLSALFNGTDRGMMLPDDVGFPLAYPWVNVVSGITENRMATFMFQSFVALIIVAALLIYMIRSKATGRTIPDGDIALLFILAYSASQIVLDSTRYDSLVLRSNGFVSMVQIISIAMLLIPILIFTVRYFQSNANKVYGIVIWILLLALMGTTGYMEYYVQNTREQFLIAYTIMSVCLAAIVGLSVLLRSLYIKNKH